MTTQAWSTVVDQSTDAAFRTWVAEFLAKLTAIGLTQTADTGQINTATVVRAAINTDAGYAIFRFNDTQQATAPLFIKFLLGSGSSQAVPRIRIQVGTASNGTGTISGDGSTNTDIVSGGGALNSTVTLYNSFACYVDGSFFISWKIGASSTAPGIAAAFYALNRSVDNSGTATADSVAQTWGGANTLVARTISFNTHTIYGGSGAAQATWTIIPYSLTSTLVGLVPQVFKTYMMTPQDRPQMQLLYANISEFALGNDTTVAVVGLTTRKYLACCPVGSNNQIFACIYE